ncbi:MAG: V-type ATP synthase subunit D [Thermoprotei archaeon]
MPKAVNVRPTRMEYLRTRRRIATARKGLRLLKLKRQALILEFFKMSRTVGAARTELREKLIAAYRNIRFADMIEGPVRLEYEAVRASRMGELSVRTKNVMGVKIPELRDGSNHDVKAEYLVELPSSIHDVVRSFEEVHKMVLSVAEKESALRRLLLEIEKTKRRSNAIENVLIPRLESAAKFIKFTFDEMERDSFIRLKNVKRKMAHRLEAE